MDLRFSELRHYTEKQQAAHEVAKTHRYTLFGGSRGPGKSFWLRWELLGDLLEYAALGLRGVRVMLACEDFPSLRERQIEKIEREFPKWLGRYWPSVHEFRIDQAYGGGVLCLRNLDDPQKYQSAEYASVGIDELTKNRESTFNEIRGSLRWPGVDRPRFRAATNPNGIGGPWVRSLWIERSFPDYLQAQANEFAFVPGLPTDNPYLPQSYQDELDALPDMLRKAWRHGDWYAGVEGLVYGEFNVDNLTDDEPDPTQPIELAFDDGYMDPRCILFIQRTGTRILVADEIYHRQHLAETCVKEAQDLCRERGWVLRDGDGKPTDKPNIDIAVGSPEAKEMQARLRLADIPVRWEVHKVVDGIGVVRRLICDGKGYRTLKVNNRCRNLKWELSEGYLYAEGKHGPEDKPVDGNDHACESLRNWAVLRAKYT